MCIAFIKREQSKIFLALNRDEFLDRSHTSITEQADNKIYGIDQRSGGTWLAFDRKGNFSVVTNIRKFSDSKEDGTSRGELPHLGLSKTPLIKTDYNPFNLTSFYNDQLFYNNYQDHNYTLIEDSTYGISNGFYPNNWEKVNKGKNYFDSLSLDDPNLFDKAKLIMQDEEKFANVPTDTGLPFEREHFLSSIFLRSETYGTVSTTLALIDKNDIIIREENFVNKTNKIIKVKKEKS